MIASLKGIIEALSQDSMILNVNGVGFKVGVPTSVLSELGIVGGEVKLFTHLHVRVGQKWQRRLDFSFRIIQ
jgi:Holliday junction DNA helicase RuvA